jgi:hypothetical protein
MAETSILTGVQWSFMTLISHFHNFSKCQHPLNTSKAAAHTKKLCIRLQENHHIPATVCHFCKKLSLGFIIPTDKHAYIPLCSKPIDSLYNNINSLRKTINSSLSLTFIINLYQSTHDREKLWKIPNKDSLQQIKLSNSCYNIQTYSSHIQ